MGRRSAAGYGKRPGAQARPVRLLPTAGRAIGFFFANGTFLLLSWLLTDQQFMEWGWRVPFIFSAVLVIIGLYVRVSLHETPVFAKVAAAKK